MNEYDNPEQINNNVKILVRIRNHPSDKESNSKLNETGESINRLDRSVTPNKSRENSFVGKSTTAKGKSSNPKGTPGTSKGRSPVKSSLSSNNSKEIKSASTTFKKTSSGSSLDESKKYTIFSSTQASNTIVVSNQPISGKLINETFTTSQDLYEYSYSILKDATLLEFDKVYNETQKLDLIYNEQVKESISNLFMGKNSCFLLFGPCDSGKSFSLRGDNNSSETGLLGRCMQDLFNLVEISKQANLNSKGRNSTFFSLKLSVYQVYLDQVNDLLTNQFNKNLKVEKYYDSENNLCSTIPDLTQKEIRNKKDYENILKEAMNFRKLLAQTLKVNEMKRKSHLVVSVLLDKHDRYSEGQGRTNEKSQDKFAQMDFVELAASNFGLSNFSENLKSFKSQSLLSDHTQWDDLLYKNTSKVFNSICNNIVASTLGSSQVSNPRYDTKLTLALKNTLRRDSQIILFSCVSPDEEPPVSNFKSLKFSNWLRNQVHNIKCNKDYKIKSQYEDDSNNENEDRPVRQKNKSANHQYIPNNNQDSEDDFKIRTQKVLKNYNERKDYLEDEQIHPSNHKHATHQENNYNYNKYRSESNMNTNANIYHSSGSGEEHEIRQLRDRMRNKYNSNSSISNQGNNFNGHMQGSKPSNLNYNYSSNEREIKSLRTLKSNNTRDNSIINERERNERNINDDQAYISCHKEEKLKDVEKSLRDLEAKSLEMSRCIDNLRNERGKIQSSNYDETMNTINTHNHTHNQTLIKNCLSSQMSGMSEMEFDKIKTENATLKSDNIIYREDINRLTDINRHLEDELTKQRGRNLELAADNERALQDKLAMKSEIEKLNETLSKTKVQEHNYMEQMNQRFMTENRIRELENECRNLRDEKQKFEIDFRVLSERHSEMRKNFENSESELSYIKTKQTEEVNSIETKLEKMSKEIEYLQRENHQLRSNEERLRTEVSSLEKQRDNYRDKYQDYKQKNNILNVKLNEIEDDFRKLILEKQVESFEKKKEEECKKMKVDTKQKILDDMQSRISSYKSELFRQRSRKEKEDF